MPATGSVRATGLSVATGQTLAFPSANLTVIGIQFNGAFISIPIDSTRNAILVNSGGTTKVNYMIHKVTFVLNGTSMTFSTFYAATTTLVAYFGSAGEGQLPLTAFAAVHIAVTLSSGAGTGTLTFPSGNLTLVGLTAVDTTAAADVTVSWSTSSGQSLFVYVPNQIAANEIMPTVLTVAQTVLATFAGTGSDVVEAIAYYM